MEFGQHVYMRKNAVLQANFCADLEIICLNGVVD